MLKAGRLGSLCPAIIMLFSVFTFQCGAEDIKLQKDGVGPIAYSGTLTAERDGTRLIARATNQSGVRIEYAKLCVEVTARKGCLFTLWNTEPWEPDQYLDWNLSTRVKVRQLLHSVSLKDFKVTQFELAKTEGRLMTLFVVASEAYSNGGGYFIVLRDQSHLYAVDCSIPSGRLSRALTAKCQPLIAGATVSGYFQGSDAHIWADGTKLTYKIKKTELKPPLPGRTKPHDGSSTSSPPAEAASVNSQGSGFVIAPDGQVLSNAHVVSGCGSVVVSIGGLQVPAAIVSVDKANDIALLKVSDPPKTFLALRDGKVKLGEPVVTLGYPLQGVVSTSLHLTSGNISSLSGLSDDSRYLQFTAPVQPGSSGGPLLDASGNVVGMVTMKLSTSYAMNNFGDVPQNINFAVKASVIREFLESQGISPRSRPLGATLPLPEVPERVGAAAVLIRCLSGATPQ